MKAVNHYIVIEPIKEALKKVGGLILTDETNEDNRYLKAKVVSIGNNVEGIEDYELPDIKGYGIDVISGDVVDMVNHGVIAPLLVTKSALKKAISVVSTIISANCVISNIRVNESS